MEIKKLLDFTNQAQQEIGQYRLEFYISPEKLKTDVYSVETLEWDSIRFDGDELNKVPNDKRGIYAFVISHPNAVLPHHGYVLYIGIAGRKSTRSIRARYKEYLNANIVIKRPHIARMIASWHEVLRFYFAPIEEDVSSSELEELERQISTALMPAFSKGDLDADTKRKRSAF